MRSAGGSGLGSWTRNGRKDGLSEVLGLIAAVVDEKLNIITSLVLGENGLRSWHYLIKLA